MVIVMMMIDIIFLFSHLYSLTFTRDEILRNDPDLQREIEQEAEKMRLEQRMLENEIAEMQAKLDEEERIRAGEKVRLAFYNIEEEKESIDVEDETGLQIDQNNLDDDGAEIIDLDVDQSSEKIAPQMKKDNSQVISNNKSLLHPKDIMREFGDQVKLDFRNFLENTCPKHIRESVTGAIGPAIRIVTKACINTYDMMKRYAKVIIGKNNELDTECTNRHQ